MICSGVPETERADLWVWALKWVCEIASVRILKSFCDSISHPNECSKISLEVKSISDLDYYGKISPVVISSLHSARHDHRRKVSPEVVSSLQALSQSKQDIPCNSPELEHRPVRVSNLPLGFAFELVDHL